MDLLVKETSKVIAAGTFDEADIIRLVSTSETFKEIDVSAVSKFWFSSDVCFLYSGARNQLCYDFSAA